MAFVIEIPSVYNEIEGNRLSLCLGGVKAYNLDNLYNRRGADEHFKIFIGFKNKVCTNLGIWTDGFMANVKVANAGQLKACIRTLAANYNAQFHLQQMAMLTGYSLTEKQFATVVGKCRMYQHLPLKMRTEISPLYLPDTQLSTICRDYYRDSSFCKDENGNINLWRLYNLLTGANKSSYIDNFVDRSVNAYQFTEALRHSLQNNTANWFLS